MPYPDDQLVAGETVLVHRHPHWRALLAPVLVLLVVATAAGFLAGFLERYDAQARLVGWILLAVAATLVLLKWTLVPVLRWRGTHFVVTSQRLLTREGILTRSGTNVPMSRVTSVDLSRGVLDRLLGCGTIVVESASEGGLTFDHVPAVKRVHRSLHQAMMAARPPAPPAPERPPRTRREARKLERQRRRER